MKMSLREKYENVRLKISVKLSAIIAVGVSVTFTIFSVILYYDIKRNLEEDVDMIVEGQLENLRNTLDDLVHLQIMMGQDPHPSNDFIYPKLQERYQNKKIFDEGFLYVMDSKGQVIIHANQEGDNFSNTSFGNQIISSSEKEGKFDFVWPENSSGQKVIQYYSYYEPYDLYIVASCKEKDVFARLFYYRNLMILGTIFVILIIVGLIYQINARFGNVLKKFANVLAILAQGKLDVDFGYTGNDEIKDIDTALHKLLEGLKKTTAFSDDISNNQLDTEFTPLSDEDVLGLSLLDMREKIKKNREAEKIRSKEEAEQKWINEGLAKFSDILRVNFENIYEQGDNIIQNLVRYVDANQGGIFVYNNDNQSDLHLELIAAFAYDTKKYMQKKVKYGEGLVGTCAVERDTILLTEIPENYFSITSGLGDAQPNCLLIVPIKKDEELLGVIELASFKVFEPYEVEFVEKIMESVAATLASIKINTRTKELLSKFEVQSKEMAEKEAEMRQNIEELQAIQEEGQKKEQTYQDLINIYKSQLYVAELDSNGFYLDVSDGLLTLMGAERGSVVGVNIFDECAPGSDEYNELYGNWRDILSGRGFVDKKTYENANGSVVLEEKYYPLQYSSGGVAKVIKIVKDITNSHNETDELEQKN